MHKILITGANSFIGRNFLKYSIFKDTANEICLIKNKPEDIDFNGIDVVFHVAAIVHQKKDIPENIYFNVNTKLPIEIAKKAKKAGVQQFVFMSTVKVYGEYRNSEQIWDENTICKPEDNYGKSKFEAEIELNKLADNNFKVSIIRTPLVYGCGVKANMASIINLVKKLPVLPLKDIDNKRSFTYIENLIAFIDKIIEMNISGIFIAKNDRDLSTSELVELIAKYLSKKIFLLKTPQFIIKLGNKFMPNIFERLYGSYKIDNSQTLKTLNFTPPYTSEEGIKKMLQCK